MTSISAVVITKNEARNVERCLRSLAGIADEIVVVDDHSTDGTAELCERLGARVVRQDWLGFGPQKNFANGLARHDWILSLDADEELDDELRRSIEAARARGLAGAYQLSRLNSYYGRFIRHGLEYPDRKVRLFPRRAARWNDSLVHEGLVLDPALSVGRLDGHLLHYTYATVAEHVARANRYTDLAAEDALRRGSRPSVARMLGSPVAVFVKSYFLKRGFLDGLHGLVLSVLHAHGAFLKHVKLWDLHRDAAARRSA